MTLGPPNPACGDCRDIWDPTYGHTIVAQLGEFVIVRLHPTGNLELVEWACRHPPWCYPPYVAYLSKDLEVKQVQPGWDEAAVRLLVAAMRAELLEESGSHPG